MKLEDKTNLEHSDDKFLWHAKLIVDILLVINCILVVILFAIGCAKIGLIYLLYMLVALIGCFVLWIFERVFLSLCHDVKIIRNKLIDTNTEITDAENADLNILPTQEIAENDTTKES